MSFYFPYLDLAKGMTSHHKSMTYVTVTVTQSCNQENIVKTTSVTNNYTSCSTGACYNLKSKELDRRTTLN